MGSSPSAPTDLRPSPATTPYHRKLQLFLSASQERNTPKSPGTMIPTPTSLRQSPCSTRRLTTPTDGTPPLARSIALCPYGRSGCVPHYSPPWLCTRCCPG